MLSTFKLFEVPGSSGSFQVSSFNRFACVHLDLLQKVCLNFCVLLLGLPCRKQPRPARRDPCPQPSWGHGGRHPCWGLTSVSQRLKIKQACGVKIIVILITVFVVVENALTPRFSKSHSLVVFSVIIFEMLLFQTQIRFRPPL